jgi:Sel1 repeat
MIFRKSWLRLVAVCAIAAASVSAQDNNLDDIQHKAEAGDALAQFHLAQTYIIGKNPVKGLVWLQKSADQGYVGAQYALAYMYLTGSETLPKDPHKAAIWFVKAAKQKNKAAQDKLAMMLAQRMISTKEANWRAADATASQTLPHKLPPPNVVKGKAAAFSLGDVETGLTGGITSKRLATLIHQFGVDFKLNASTRKRLADDGADDELLATISASNRSL